MAFLSLTGYGTITVAIGTVRRSVVLIGVRQRAYSGSMRESKQDEKTEITVTTPLTAPATIDSLFTALTGTPPLSFAGDLWGGATDCYVDIGDREYVEAGDGPQARLTFTMREA